MNDKHAGIHSVVIDGVIVWEGTGTEGYEMQTAINDALHLTLTGGRYLDENKERFDDAIEKLRAYHEAEKSPQLPYEAVHLLKPMHILKNGFGAWAEAFMVFAMYEPDESFSVQAEHDIIYAAHTPPDKMGYEHRAHLEFLGWDWDDDLGRWTRSV